jgi:hypothetical protein
MIVMDISGSMSTYAVSKTRFEIVKDAIAVVISALSNSDWVGFVSFSAGAKS